MRDRPQRTALNGRYGRHCSALLLVGAATLCLVFTACSSSRASVPAPSSSVVPAGSATGVTTAWRLTGRAESKSRCERMDPPVEVDHPGADYPERVRQEGIAGTVVLQAALSGDGVPAAIKVTQSADRRLVSLALEAFRAWRYKSAVCDGSPIDTYVTATFSFSLKPLSGATSR